MKETCLGFGLLTIGGFILGLILAKLGFLLRLLGSMVGG